LAGRHRNIFETAAAVCAARPDREEIECNYRRRLTTAIAGADILPARSVPLYCNVLRKDRAAAMAAARGVLALRGCSECGHVFNEAFDENALDYTPDYENSLHHSAHFSGYAEDLARRLVDRYDLNGKFIIDVGCGLGDFIALLCRLGGNRGIGYDKSCPTSAPTSDGNADVTLIQQFFTPEAPLAPIDFLCCRQVLEHIADPVAFIEAIKRSAAVTAETTLFFEVPNSAYTFEGVGVWDLIYEHCSYFSERSLTTLFRRCGFDVIATYELFSGQYLGLEARIARGSVGRTSPAPMGADIAAPFAERHAATLARWRDAVQTWESAGERVVIWGAGSKGVCFLDALRPGLIEFAVDLNPRKAGRFLPGSGAEVVAPAFLTEYRPDRVILMNAVYRDEVAHMLSSLGLFPAIVAA
jgi:SAM-dependent methyltransferase